MMQTVNIHGDYPWEPRTTLLQHGGDVAARADATVGLRPYVPAPMVVPTPASTSDEAAVSPADQRQGCGSEDL